MTTLDIDKLDLSGSDSEDLFASPTKALKKSQKVPSKAPEKDTSVPGRNGESRYDAEATREASLKRELEGVRSINEVIEGVVSSLETAKGNMDVRHFLQYPRSAVDNVVDSISDSHLCIHSSEYMDTNSFTNRTQPTSDSESQLERCKCRCGGYGE